MQNHLDCYQKVKKKCFNFITSQETKKEKFKNKEKMIKSFLIPICFWINKNKPQNKTFIIGLAGGQGTGKTTISSLIRLILTNYFKLNVFKVSIDDFYRTRKERLKLSKSKHPLLLTRGVPGTHDVDMMNKLFSKILFTLALVLPGIVNACPVCFAAEEEARKAFLGSTAFLTLLPIIMIFSVVFFIRRKFVNHHKNIDESPQNTDSQEVIPFNNK